jgi:hypothetical protein
MLLLSTLMEIKVVTFSLRIALNFKLIAILLTVSVLLIKHLYVSIFVATDHVSKF